MPTETRLPRLAVLIDADNASARIATGLFEEIARIGEASVRRIYGDFSSSRLKSWTDLLARHAIMPQQTFAYTTGKNASDMALAIDAMDLLHGGRVDGFCLVSSDSDFTGLAMRVREQGVSVYGFGERKTPVAFVQACNRFIYTENLLPEAPAAGEPERPDTRPASVVQPASEALPRFIKAMATLDAEDGWAELGPVGKQLRILFPDFDPRNYGHRILSTLAEKTGGLDVRRTEGGGAHIRRKSMAKAASAPAKAAPMPAKPVPAAKPAPAKAAPVKAAPMRAAPVKAAPAKPAAPAKAGARQAGAEPAIQGLPAAARAKARGD